MAAAGAADDDAGGDGTGAGDDMVGSGGPRAVRIWRRGWAVAELARAAGRLGFPFFLNFIFFSQFFLFACGRFKRPHVRMRLPWPHAKIVILAYDFAHMVGPTTCENRFPPHAKTTSVVVRRTRALPSLLEPVRRDQLTTTS